MRYYFGSVSTDTLNPERLIDTFAAELDYQLARQPQAFQRREEFRALIRRAEELTNDDDTNLLVKPDIDAEQWLDTAHQLIDELMGALNEFAPPYGYFGALRGGSTDFGYWLDYDSLAEFDGLRVADTADVPRDYCGEVLLRNDHGNLTLYVARTGKLREIWSVV